MSLDSEKMGERISKIRKGKGLTQEDLAEILDVTPKHVSHVERGKSNYSLQQLAAFCEYTGCSMDYIVFGESINDTVSKLPDGIIEILNGSNGDRISILQRYLRLFLEISDSVI